MSVFANWINVNCGSVVVGLAFEERVKPDTSSPPVASVVMVRSDAEALRDLLIKLLATETP